MAPHSETQRRRARLHPVALSIAGSDSGGGAGVQADLRAFAAFGVFGTTAITALTAQNPDRVSGIQAATPDMLRQQIVAVSEAFEVAAVKTGMLFSAPLVEAVAGELDTMGQASLVVDPVMVATSGARLLETDAIRAVKRLLLHRALLITPNIPEAEILTDLRITREVDMIAAARDLHRRYGCAVLIKGGHRPAQGAIDILVSGKDSWRLRSHLVDAPSTHGSGCSLSAACAAVLAGDPDIRLVEAVIRAKAYVLASLCNCIRVGSKTWAMGPGKELPASQIVCERVPGNGE